MVHFQLAALIVVGISAKLSAQTSILDNTFGTNGTTRVFTHGGDSTNDEAYGVAIQSDDSKATSGSPVDFCALPELSERVQSEHHGAISSERAIQRDPGDI